MISVRIPSVRARRLLRFALATVAAVSEAETFIALWGHHAIAGGAWAAASVVAGTLVVRKPGA
ncbi:MAG: hypothetical protein ACLGP3_08575 [Acidobacteriota bacterium]